MKSGIKFVNADNAGLVFTINTNDGEIQRRADTVEDGVYFVQKHGFATVCNFSSDMDFASEEGFATDGCAKVMFNEICASI